MQSPRAAYRAVPGALVFPPSAFDHPHRPDLRHLATDPRAVHDVNHAGDVFVRLGDLFVDRRPGGGTHQDALSLELLHDVSGPGHELGLVTTEPPPRAVAARPEGLAERAVRSQQHVRVAAHVSRDYHRLAEVPEPGAELGVPRWERPRRAFAMHAQAARLSLHVVRLVLGDVVAYIVHDVGLLARLPEDPGECAPREVCHHLAIGEGIVRGGVHGPPVVLAFG